MSISISNPVISEKNGILFYNDSLATIPEAAIEAMEALPDTETLIAGGHDRGLDFKVLGQYLNKGQIKTLILFPQNIILPVEESNPTDSTNMPCRIHTFALCKRVFIL